jgi:hypothetical protein
MAKPMKQAAPEAGPRSTHKFFTRPLRAVAVVFTSFVHDGPVGFEREPDDNGERLIWLEPHIVNKLRYLRGPGESYSDVILRLPAGAA